MPARNSSLLFLALAGAVLLAIFRQDPQPAAAPVIDNPHGTAASEPASEDQTEEREAVPPRPEPTPAPALNDAPAIAWKAPAKWTVAPNANAMRLATYHVPPAGGAADEAELTVVKAGGSTEANLTRWVGQFTDAAPSKRTEKTIHGLRVALIELTGTFAAAPMGPGGAAAPRKDWTLDGAVVETEKGTYFFKLTGPSATVRAAHADFDALVGSIAPRVNTTNL